MTTANRGKVAENLVKRRLEVLARSANFVWYRPPDMRGGHRQEALADFVTLDRGVVTLIEVKETQHDFRLPHGNVGAGQIARMRMWEAAGGRGVILVYHSTIGKWRRLDPELLVTRTGGSWDLRPFDLFNLEDVLC